MFSHTWFFSVHLSRSMSVIIYFLPFRVPFWKRITLSKFTLRLRIKLKTVNSHQTDDLVILLRFTVYIINITQHRTLKNYFLQLICLEFIWVFTTFHVIVNMLVLTADWLRLFYQNARCKESAIYWEVTSEVKMSEHSQALV